MRSFETIGLTGKPDDAAVCETVNRLAHHLGATNRTILLDGETVPDNSLTEFERRTREALARDVDLLIAVGGDGTLLNAARLYADHELAILGVNRGRLGFLVDVSPGNFEEIDAVLGGDYIVDERVLLTAEIRRGQQVISQGVALNDVVLHKWNTARMIDFQTWIDGELCNRHRSDGLIVSTPTGSTAYAMAGGGPILHPSLDAVALVPICPHTLSNRPLVISSESTVEVVVEPQSIDQIRVSCDSQDDLGVVNGGRIVISRRANKVRLIHPPRYRYFDILRAKLRWGDGNPV
jgi:NAD+ kinase